MHTHKCSVNVFVWSWLCIGGNRRWCECDGNVHELANAQEGAPEGASGAYDVCPFFCHALEFAYIYDLKLCHMCLHTYVDLSFNWCNYPIFSMGMCARISYICIHDFQMMNQDAKTMCSRATYEYITLSFLLNLVIIVLPSSSVVFEELFSKYTWLFHKKNGVQVPMRECGCLQFCFTDPSQDPHLTLHRLSIFINSLSPQGIPSSISAVILVVAGQLETNKRSSEGGIHDHPELLPAHTRARGLSQMSKRCPTNRVILDKRTLG